MKNTLLSKGNKLLTGFAYGIGFTDAMLGCALLYYLLLIQIGGRLEEPDIVKPKTANFFMDVMVYIFGLGKAARGNFSENEMQVANTDHAAVYHQIRFIFMLTVVQAMFVLALFLILLDLYEKCSPCVTFWTNYNYVVNLIYFLAVLMIVNFNSNSFEENARYLVIVHCVFLFYRAASTVVISYTLFSTQATFPDEWSKV